MQRGGAFVEVAGRQFVQLPGDLASIRQTVGNPPDEELGEVDLEIHGTAVVDDTCGTEMVVGARQAEDGQPGCLRCVKARNHFGVQGLAVRQCLAGESGMVGLDDAVTGPVARDPVRCRQQCGLGERGPIPRQPTHRRRRFERVRSRIELPDAQRGGAGDPAQFDGRVGVESGQTEPTSCQVERTMIGRCRECAVSRPDACASGDGGRVLVDGALDAVHGQ